jgi:hypothetical protein
MVRDKAKAYATVGDDGGISLQFELPVDDYLRLAWEEVEYGDGKHAKSPATLSCANSEIIAYPDDHDAVQEHYQEEEDV